ncbi:MAG: hypothetical protein KBA53_13605 [Thermoclostridium sp.]|nr:hypothetical protein [Thermoclostridium sp.]
MPYEIFIKWPLSGQFFDVQVTIEPVHTGAFQTLKGATEYLTHPENIQGQPPMVQRAVKNYLKEAYPWMLPKKEY